MFCKRASFLELNSPCSGIGIAERLNQLRVHSCFAPGSGTRSSTTSAMSAPGSPTTGCPPYAALQHPRVIELLAGAAPRKIIVVPGRLVSIVV